MIESLTVAGLKGLLDTPGGWALFAGIVFLILMTTACHEAGHALVAWWSGDRRPVLRRRVTLNPLNHIHWFLTLVLPLLSFYLFGWIIGGAKPVQVDFGRIGRWKMGLVAMAGPAGNFLFAGFCVAGMGLAIANGWVSDVDPIHSVPWKLVRPALWFSVILALFNLVPLPPLDGSRVVGMFMPGRMLRVWYSLAPLGVILALGLWLWFTGQLQSWGLGEGHPEVFRSIDAKVESAIFATARWWEGIL